FENLSMLTTDRRYVVNVLANESAMVGAAVLGGATDPPADTPIPTSGPTAGEIPSSAALTGGPDGPALEPNQNTSHSTARPTSGPGGVFLLDRIDLFNLLCVPGETTPAVLSNLQQFCHDRRAFLIADCAQNATFDGLAAVSGLDPSLTGANAINAAFYFPWIVA